MSSNFQKHDVFVKNKQQNCESCGKSFPTTQGLKRHIHAVHEGHKYTGRFAALFSCRGKAAIILDLLRQCGKYAAKYPTLI